MNSDFGSVGRGARWSELVYQHEGDFRGGGDCLSLPGGGIEGIRDIEGSGRSWEMGHQQPSMAWSHRGQQGHPMTRSAGRAAVGDEVHPSLGPK